MDDRIRWAALWLAAINAFALVQMGRDKRAAERGHRRTPERRLVLPVLLGGLPGVLLGMKVFRHKTKKASFQRLLAFSAGLFGLAAWLLWRAAYPAP